MLTLIVTLVYTAPAFAGSSISINGKTWSCDGSMTSINGEMTCNGKKMTEGSNDDDAGPCGGSKTRRAANGGGQIDVRATVPAEARVDGTICGATSLDKSSIVQKGARLNGDFTLGRNALVKSGAILNGGGRIGENVVIGEGSTLNGNINLANTEISRGTVLNGNINLDGVKMSGNMKCSGNGNITVNPSPGTAN